MRYSIKEAAIILQAQRIVAEKLSTYSCKFSGSPDVKRFLSLALENKAHEEFHILFLNTRGQLIATECLTTGTFDGASVYPREVVKRVLAHNAASVILAHNHPSGSTEPSQADRVITNRLKDALALVGTTVLDHVIIGGGDTLSFAEVGLI